MHFTLWPSRFATQGGYSEVSWGDFLSFVARPLVAPVKDDLEGWSPAKFGGDGRRQIANVEAVSCVGLDFDSSKVTLAELAALFAGIAGVIHTTHSHNPPETPKYRVVLRCSRDLTAAEQGRVWAWWFAALSARGHVIDRQTRDPARLWYVPAHREGAPYEWCEITGEALDVDAILQMSGAAASPPMEATMARPGTKASAPAAHAGERITSSSVHEDGASARRRSQALALAAVWPPHGERHPAKLALAGALRGEGWSKDEAREFFRVLYDATGSTGDIDTEALNSTFNRDADAPLTGWTRLKSFVDPVVVDAARAALGRRAEMSEAISRRLAEAAARSNAENVAKPTETLTAPAPAPNASSAPELVTKGPFTFKVGNLNAELPPLVYQIEGVFCKGDVVMLVAHGNSLKTWLAFSLALAVSTGRTWLEKYPVKRGRAAILDFESGDYEVTRRLKLLGAKDEMIDGRLLRCSFSAAQLTDPEAWVALAELQLDLLVIDSFKAASPPDTDENDARADALLQMAGKFADATGCTIIVIHHARKGGGGDAREKVRGSTALFAACDRIFEFAEPEKSDDGRVATTMHSVKDGAGRRPADIRVELSDQGLKWLELPKEPEEPKESNRDRILRALTESPNGLPKATVIDLLKGTKATRLEDVAQLQAASIVIESKNGKDKWLWLSPHAKR